jgi:acyl-CoA reductase-like NAD-dependent aldehyde dehydrogenase
VTPAAPLLPFTVGKGMDPANQMGPLANERRIAAIETLVTDANAKGARVTTRGTRIGNRGYYFPLTVVADVPDDAQAMREEPFGALALLSRVRSDARAAGIIAAGDDVGAFPSWPAIEAGDALGALTASGGQTVPRPIDRH